MRNLCLRSITSFIIIGSMSTLTFATDASPNLQSVFKTACVNSWMERANESSDKVAFQNFGEKFCNCASTKPVGTEAEVDKAAQLCMSQTLLHDSMDTLEDSEGLSKITEEKIQTSCQNKWQMIYPKMDEKEKAFIASYCKCATPKLDELVKDQDNVTDQQYSERIDVIASECSGGIRPDKAAKTAKKS